MHIDSTTPSLGEWIHMVMEEVYEDRKREKWKGLALVLTITNTVTACSKAALFLRCHVRDKARTRATAWQDSVAKISRSGMGKKER